jgi:hypothetical protein
MTTLQKRKKRVIGALERAELVILQGWTRGAFARDKRGQEVLPRSPRAVQWCASGALGRVTCGKTRVIAEQVLDVQANNVGAEGIAEYNDEHAPTRHAVLRLFRNAVDALRG